MSSWNFGAILGPILSGLLYQFFGGRITFILLVIWCLGCLVAVSFGIKVQRTSFAIPEISNSAVGSQESAESPQFQTDDQWLNSLSKRIKIGMYIFAYGMILLSSFYLITLQSYYVGYAYVYTEFSPWLIGVIVFCLPIGRGISFAVMGKIKVRDMINLVPLLCIIAMFLVYFIPLITQIAVLILFFMLTGFISGFAFSGSFYIVTGLSEEKRGLFVGLLESTVGVSMATSTLIPFYVLGDNPLSPFVFALYIIGALAIIFIAIRMLLYFALKNDKFKKIL